MVDKHVQAAADGYFDRIVSSPMATRLEFLERIIERLQSHHRRMSDLRGEGNVNYDALPDMPVLGQASVSVRFALDRFYVVHSSVPIEAHMDEPKVTTLRATPGELLEYIRQGSAKTEDFQMKIVANAGVIPVECVEIHIINQNDTALIFPLHLPKAQLEGVLREIVDSDTD